MPIFELILRAREMASPFLTRKMRFYDRLDSGIGIFLHRREGGVITRSGKGGWKDKTP